MSIVLSHSIARAYWAARGTSIQGSLPTAPSKLADSAPTTKLVDAARRELDKAGVVDADSVTLDVLVPHSNQKRNISGVDCHVCSGPLPARSLVYLAPSVYISCVELCALQAAESLPFAELVEYYLTLCSSYFDEGSFVAAQSMTSVSKLHAYFGALAGRRGIKPARRALRYTKDHARSPKEVALCLALLLPMENGGLEVRKLMLDYKLDLSPTARRCTARRHLICDLMLPHGRIDVEYNGRAHNATGRRVADEERADVLASMGFHLVNVSAGSLYNSAAFRRKLETILRYQGRMTPSPEDPFWDRQEQLRQFVLRHDTNEAPASSTAALL